MKKYNKIILLAFMCCCISCVQEVHKKTIHVSVDMKNLENLNNVGIRGNHPLSWSETTLLEDADKDSIYEGTFEVNTAQYSFEFKFVNNEVFELPDQNNRELKFEYKPEIIELNATFNNPKTIILKK